MMRVRTSNGVFNVLSVELVEYNVIGKRVRVITPDDVLVVVNNCISDLILKDFLVHGYCDLSSYELVTEEEIILKYSDMYASVNDLKKGFLDYVFEDKLWNNKFK